MAVYRLKPMGVDSPTFTGRTDAAHGRKWTAGVFVSFLNLLNTVGWGVCWGMHICVMNYYFIISMYICLIQCKSTSGGIHVHGMCIYM